jgi:hypothetical protein
MADLTIDDVSGGMNDADPATAVPKDQCLVAENVEFVNSTLGERRAGAAAVTITGSGLEDRTHLSWLHRHLPSADETAAELWAFSVTPGVSSRLSRKTTSWNTVTPTDAIGIAGVEGFALDGQTLHQKLFLAHKSAVDRLHVWDGTTLRPVGLKAPTAAPTGANDGGVGTFAGKRYFRIRYTVQVAGTTILRSEPSAVLTFTPNGNDTGIVVTKPVTISENETHWELEASLNNGDFYRVATTVVGTTTVTDTVAFATGYAATGTLSEDVGDYTVPISAKFVSVDNDRLLMAGSWEQPALGSRFSWTPVGGDITGVGNDERVPLDTNNFLDLDATENGEFTGLSGAVGSYVYLTKHTAIYRAVRSGDRNKAYEAFPLTKRRGAIKGSLVEGIDQVGNACLYGLDRSVGPWRVNEDGLRRCGRDIETTWGTVNVNATTVVTCGVFYPDSMQVIWWVAVNGGNTPTHKIVLQTNQTRNGEEGVRRGWSVGTSDSATAISACLFADNINDNVARTVTLRPFIGRTGAAASILRLDTGTTDAGTVYRARVVTRPYLVAGLLNKFGAMAAGVLAKAATGVTLFVKVIRDFGVESLTVDTLLTADGTETHVIKPLDDLNFSEMHALQLEYGDDTTAVVTPAGTWEVHMIGVKPRVEETP